MPGASSGRGHERQTETTQGGQASSRAPAGPWSHRRLAPGSGLSGLCQTLPEAICPQLERKGPPGGADLGLPPLSPGDLRKQQQAREQHRPPPSQLPLPEARGAPPPEPVSGLEGPRLHPPLGEMGGPQHGRLIWSHPPRRALQVEVDGPAPDHQLQISRARELLKENAWATRQSSWHRRGRPRPGPEAG